MLICFRVNLGSRDADRYGLDFRSCQIGLESNVSDEVGKQLISRGLATEIVVPSEIKAVPEPPTIQAAESVPATEPEPTSPVAEPEQPKKRR